MKVGLSCAFLLLALAAPAHAKGVEGHYFLEGVMETGSELLLRPNGRFQYYLVYGALDMIAEGDWREEGGHVLLVTRKKQSNAPDGEPQPFDTLDLTITHTVKGGTALLTELWGRNVTYVRHADDNSGD